jgi:hypothetical protein
MWETLDALFAYAVLYPWELIKSVLNAILFIPWFIYDVVVDYGQLWTGFGVFINICSSTIDNKSCPAFDTISTMCNSDAAVAVLVTLVSISCFSGLRRRSSKSSRLTTSEAAGEDWAPKGTRRLLHKASKCVLQRS